MLIKRGAAAVALVLFYMLPIPGHASLPLTETIGTLPEGKTELIAGERIYTHGSGFRQETLGFSFGILPALTISFYFQYLHRGILEPRESEIGDSFLRLWLFIGDYWDDTLHVGLMGLMRLPTGVNAYRSETWRPLAFGNNELRIGPVVQKDLDRVYLHFNVFYVFRERDGEGLYDTLYLNPLDQNTYEKLFGLNFTAEKTFLEPARLRNDYCVVALGVNTEYFYPFIPFTEVYTSFRLNGGTIREDELPVEGGGVFPVMLSAGGRYFFTRAAYGGLYCIINLVRIRGFQEETFGMDLGIQF